MSKVKFKLKLTGLEVEFEGTKDDLPLLSNAFGNQLQSLITPPTEIVDGQAEVVQSTPSISQNQTSKAKSRNRSRAQQTSQKKNTEGSFAFDWKQNDSVKYSSPTQDWKTMQKATWMLFVVEGESGKTELSATEIADNFNKNFRQLGTIRGTNISRDFGQSKKLGKEALVGEDTTGSPSLWYLTAKGKESVKALINPENTLDSNT